MQYEKHSTGRYEDNVAEFLHKMAQTGSVETVGDIDTNGFKAMLVAIPEDEQKYVSDAGHGYEGAVAAIVVEDSGGFITVEVFTSDEDAAEAWEGYSGDAEHGDGEERRDTVNSPDADDSDEEDSEEPAEEVAQVAEAMGASRQAALGLDQFPISRTLPHRGVCATCQREGRMYQYGYRDRDNRNVTWYDEPFCNLDCMRSFHGMAESKKAQATAKHEELSPAAKRVALGCRLIEAGMAPSTALDKVLSGKVLAEEDSLMMAIKTGDTISITGPDGQKVTGVSIKKVGDAWVLDVGEGGQGMATKDTIVSVDVGGPPAMAMDMPGMEPMGEIPAAEPMPDEVGAPADLPPLEGSPDMDMEPIGVGELPEPEPEEEEEEEIELP